MNLAEKCILLTFDVEDWFQVENFKRNIPFSSWSDCELRVERNTHLILDLLDSVGVQRQRSSKPEFQNLYMNDWSDSRSLKATFFVLGWIGERLPQLVREIRARGHEVASHGYYHKLCKEEQIADLKKDLMDSKKLLSDIIGAPIYGYRAPSFSITDNLLRVIESCGYLYDSSFNSFGAHGRYGQIYLRNHRKNGIAAKVSNSFYELPISNIELGKCIIPWGGGGYFRLTPLSLFKLGVNHILSKKQSYLFYLHPWEIDPWQPKVKDPPVFLKFRHYFNLDRTHTKLRAFIDAFDECRFITCLQYLREHGCC